MSLDPVRGAGASGNPGSVAPSRARLAEQGESVKRRRSAEHWIVLAGAWIGLLGLAALGIVLRPDPRGYGTHEQLGFLPCLPMVLWQIPCPGCGVTTSVVLALHGDLRAALVTQPFGLFVVLATLFLAAWATFAHLRGSDVKHELEQARMGRIALAVLVLLGLCWAYKVAAVRGWIG